MKYAGSIFLVLSLMLGACGSKDSDIYGTWKLEVQNRGAGVMGWISAGDMIIEPDSILAKGKSIKVAKWEKEKDKIKAHLENGGTLVFSVVNSDTMMSEDGNVYLQLTRKKD